MGDFHLKLLRFRAFRFSSMSFTFISPSEDVRQNTRHFLQLSRCGFHHHCDISLNRNNLPEDIGGTLTGRIISQGRSSRLTSPDLGDWGTIKRFHIVGRVNIPSLQAFTEINIKPML
jgi:hypothetical protein